MERCQRRRQRDLREAAQKPVQVAQWPADVPHWARPLWKQTQQEQEAVIFQKKRERERVAGRQENPAGEYSRVGDGEGGPKAYGGAEILGGITRE